VTRQTAVEAIARHARQESDGLPRFVDEQRIVMSAATTQPTGGSLIYLRGWYHAEGVAVTGIGHPSPIQVIPDERADSIRCQGFFHNFERRIPCAVFVAGGRLFLQMADQRWDWLADDVRIKHRRRWWVASRDTVSVYAAGQRRFQAVYEPCTAELVRAGDMTVDWMDECSDWWFWLSRVIGDQKRREGMVALWEKGI
jgi:hypothetical protein